jgi:TolB protein
MQADGTNLQRLTSGTADALNPAWSPDGNHIVFASNRASNWDIYTMHADGSNQQRRTTSPADDIDPAWAP